MAHLHGVIDVDKHFVIDAATREITNQSDKITLMQNDHNSERFTFEIPREIDGHDMSLCNVVRVHYLNIDTTTKAQNPGFYEVEDLQISPDDESVIIGSWLISSNATKNVGNLNFTIRFKCIADDGAIEYAWSSAIFKGISVGQSYNNTGVIAEEYADIFSQWQARIEALEQGGIGGIVDETDPTVPEWAKQPEKPEYTADEISYSNPEAGIEDGTVSEMITAAVGIINEDLPTLKEDSHKHNNKHTLDNIDSLFARKEEVPTVPEWAQASKKPEYSAEEIGYKNPGYPTSYDNVGDLLNGIEESFDIDIPNLKTDSHTHANKDVLDDIEDIFAKKSEVSVRKTSAVTFSPDELTAYPHDENRISLLSWEEHSSLRVGKEIKTIQIKYNGKYIDIHELHTLDAIPYALNMNKVFVDETDSGGYVLASLGRVGEWGALATALRLSDAAIEEFYVLYYI